MLDDFFQLKSPFKVIETEQGFLALLDRTDTLRDLLIQPDLLVPKGPHSRISRKRFRNVSFTKTEIVGIEFTDCVFVDCLFIATHFNRCEFHGCSFERCNLHRARFTSCYIDPTVFERTLSPRLHSNIGVSLFQQLMRNSANTHQPDHFNTAQYLFRRWQRYQYLYEFKHGRRRFPSFIARWLPNLLYDYLFGSGIRLGPFVRLTVILILVAAAGNYLLWSNYHFGEGPVSADSVSFLASLYYTIVTMTSLGFNDPGPHSMLGMLASGILAVLGVLWFAFLASMIVKRVLK